MKAARFTEYGHADVVQLTEVDKPTPKTGQVLVKVEAVSLNPFDTVIREGYLKNMIPLELPVTIGGDIAGTVEEVSDGVEHVAVGDRVYGQANVVAGNSGACAEYAATSANQVSKAPANLDLQQAASLPLVGASALQALVTHINLQAGQKILIQGGSGGIGSVAIQIAKHLGAHVATTASGAGLDYVKQLGADEVIDYKAADFTKLVKDYDAVFDTAGGESYEKSLTVLKPGGIVVTMAAQVNADEAKDAGVTAIQQSTEVTADRLNELTKLIEAGVVTPHIDKTFDFDHIQAAFEAREGGKVLGKVVVAIA